MGIWMFEPEGAPYRLRQLRAGEGRIIGQVYIRPAQLEDLPAMQECERACWPNEQDQASPGKMAERIIRYPEGILLAIRDDIVLGIVCVQGMNYDWTKTGAPEQDYYHLNDYGYLGKHDPTAHTLVGANIGVRPDAPKLIGTALLQGIFALAMRDGFLYFHAGCRMPGYGAVKSEYRPREYVALRDSQGRVKDRVVGLYDAIGFSCVDVHEQFYEDAESANCAAIMRWTNPFRPYALPHESDLNADPVFLLPSPELLVAHARLVTITLADLLRTFFRFVHIWGDKKPIVVRGLDELRAFDPRLCDNFMETIQALRFRLIP